MKFLRFALVALCLVGIAVCLHALGVLAGVFPAGKLPPYPAWTAVHFVSGIVFAVLSPLQLWPAVRRRSLRTHRLVGRTAVVTGAILAFSGVAIAYLAPERPVAERIFMTTFFVIYGGLLALGFRAALARDLAAHRAWMVRMTAVALTPLTQRLVFGAFAATLGVDGLDGFWQLFTSAAWIAFGLNVAGAEAWLRGGATAPDRRARPLAA